jgi:hypothetical protein
LFTLYKFYFNFLNKLALSNIASFIARLKACANRALGLVSKAGVNRAQTMLKRDLHRVKSAQTSALKTALAWALKYEI